MRNVNKDQWTIFVVLAFFTLAWVIIFSFPTEPPDTSRNAVQQSVNQPTGGKGDSASDSQGSEKKASEGGSIPDTSPAPPPRDKSERIPFQQESNSAGDRDPEPVETPWSEIDTSNLADERSSDSQLGETPNSRMRYNPSRFASLVSQAYGISQASADQIIPDLLRVANASEISPMLLASIVMVESSYNPEAISHAGAIGLTQVMPQFWENGLCSDLRLDEAVGSLYCGARILKKYERMCERRGKTVACAIRYYNVGPTAIRSNASWAIEAADRYQDKVLQRFSQIHDAAISSRYALLD